MDRHPDELEFWLDGNVFSSIRSSHQPMVGDLVSIRGITYRVTSRNYALDYSDDRDMRHMRIVCNMELVKKVRAPKKAKA